MYDKKRKHLETKICVICGKKFPIRKNKASKNPELRGKNCKTCSSACSKEYAKVCRKIYKD